MAIGAAQKWYAGAAVASIAVVAGGWFLLVSPQNSNADEIKARTASVQSSNASTEQQIAALKAEFKDLPTLQTKVAEIRTRLPQAPNEPTLLRTLTVAAAKSGVVLAAVQAQAPQPMTGGATTAGGNALSAPGAVAQIPVNLSITGTFAQTRLFLNSLESMQRSMLVTGLDISAGTAASGVTNLNTSVTAKVFMATPGAAATAPTTSTTGAGTAGAAS